MGKKLYLIYGGIVVAITVVIHLLFSLRPDLSLWVRSINELFTNPPPLFGTPWYFLFGLGIFFYVLYFFLWGTAFAASFGKVNYPEGSEGFTPPISVLVPAQNEEKVIGDTLESYKTANYPKDKLELVVIASGSTDKTVEICEKYKKDLNIQIVTEAQSKKGKPAALNLGLKHASNDIICVYDADNHVLENTLNALIRPLFDSTIDVVVGPSQVRNWQTNAWTKATYVDFCYFCSMGLYFEVRNRLGRNLWILGRNYAIRKAVIEEFGGWNEDALTEDLHLSTQLTVAGKKFFHVPEAMSTEIAPTTWEGIKKQRNQWVAGYKQSLESAMELDKRSVILRNFGMLHYGHMVNFAVVAIVAALIFGLVGDFFVMTICLIVFGFCMGLVIQAIRKYGQGRYSLLLYFPYYFVLMFYMFAVQFKDLSEVEWEVTDKAE